MRLIIVLLLFCNTAFASKERIFNELLRQGIDTLSAQVFTAQAALESGNFTNKLYRDHNNPFAILHSKYRKCSTSLGGFGRAEGRSGYASYASIEAATQDFLCFLTYWGVSHIQHSTGLYSSRLKYLKNGSRIRQYYTSPLSDYKKALYQRYKQLWK